MGRRGGYHVTLSALDDGFSGFSGGFEGSGFCWRIREFEEFENSKNSGDLVRLKNSVDSIKDFG